MEEIQNLAIVRYAPVHFHIQTLEVSLKFDFSEKTEMRIHDISTIGFSIHTIEKFPKHALSDMRLNSNTYRLFLHQIHAIVDLKLSRSLNFIFTHLHHFAELLPRRCESDQTSVSESSIASMLGFRMQIILDFLTIELSAIRIRWNKFKIWP